ncbi:MAG: ABC transporter substrate-binding protein [Geminicoccaceae bacterium]|nr:ABC transporter substrate-binding protein [Geminicoccaceae bacterium]
MALLVSAPGLFGRSEALGAAAADPETFVTEVGDQVLTILDDASLDDAGKIAHLKTLLDEYADLDLLAKLILGRHWRTATADQRDAYVDAFRQLVMTTMADRLHQYGGQTFEVVGSQTINDRDSIVKSKIVQPSGAPPIAVDWRLRKSDTGYAIIDVIAEGVSLVVSQRSEVNDIVAKQGMDGLIRTMRDRVSKRDAIELPTDKAG